MSNKSIRKGQRTLNNWMKTITLSIEKNTFGYLRQNGNVVVSFTPLTKLLSIMQEEKINSVGKEMSSGNVESAIMT